jgi:hypothetical protein
MSETLSENSVAQLFTTVLQHAKCIEVRIDYAKALTSQKQKYALAGAQSKINAAINHLCGLLPDSDTVLRVKKDLDRADLVYIMLITEQLMRVPPQDLEDVVDHIQNFLDARYGKQES